MKKAVYFVLFLFVCIIFGFSNSLAKPLEDNKWITDWLLCGPVECSVVPGQASELVHLNGFEIDYLKSIGGEENPQIHEDLVFQANGMDLKWTIFADQDSLVDLDKSVSGKENVLAYAYCEIDMDNDKVCLLSLGTNDGGRLWLNGQVIWDNPEPRGLVPDDDMIPVRLHKGVNTILLKVEERGGSWGFCMRFKPFDSTSLARQTGLFSVKTNQQGKSFLVFKHPVAMAGTILKKVTLSVSLQNDPDNMIWTGTWDNSAQMPILNNFDPFEKYILKIESLLADGKKWIETHKFCSGKRTVYTLFQNQQTDYVIVIGENASGSEQWAANELRNYLKKISGADFPVCFAHEKTGTPKILVGFNQTTRKLLGNAIKEPDILDESFTYKNVGPNILIWGGKQRGTMYGVMAFLENELGCRWYAPIVESIPEQSLYSFDYLNHSESPGVRVRNDFYYEAFNPVWAARNKMNGSMNTRIQPGGVEAYWAVHTFYRFMPPEEFFGSHPEYFSLVNGKRTWDHAQLCLTNPDVLSIITERLKDTMRKYPDNLIYSVSQNDWRNPCQCEKCQALAQQEESESGPLIWFVNKVAEAIEKEFPDKFVGTLAYQYTRKPCKTIKPRHNVVIRLCSIECCFAHDFQHCPENKSFMDDLKGWAEISPHLYIWDYVVNFSHYIQPYPNFYVLQPNIQTLAQNKAIGIMEQAAYQSRGGEFAELRAYVISKLLWNPYCDMQAVINDFMYGYYGRSGQFVRQYFDLLHDQVTPDTHIHLGLRPDDLIFSDDFICQADKIFDKAQKVAKNDTLLHRVEMARLPLLYLKCKRNPVCSKYDGTYEQFNKIVKREGITHYAERGEAHRIDFHREVDSAQ